MNEEQYGRDTSRTPRDGRIERADGIDVVKNSSSQNAASRTVAPPQGTTAARGNATDVDTPRERVMDARSHLRAVERPSGQKDAVGNAVETVGAAVGWTTGYVRSRPPSAMRSDAERLLVASPALALVAAVGFGYLVGSFIRR